MNGTAQQPCQILCLWVHDETNVMLWGCLAQLTWSGLDFIVGSAVWHQGGVVCGASVSTYSPQPEAVVSTYNSQPGALVSIKSQQDRICFTGFSGSVGQSLAQSLRTQAVCVSGPGE